MQFGGAQPRSHKTMGPDRRTDRHTDGTYSITLTADEGGKYGTPWVVNVVF